MGEFLPSLAEYFDVSILGSLNFMCVVAKSKQRTNKHPLLCLLKKYKLISLRCVETECFACAYACVASENLA